MPKYLKIVFAIIIAIGLIYIVKVALSAQASKKDGFRQTNWGMSADEVKASEDLKLKKEESSDNKKDLYYEPVLIAGYKADVIYEFENNKLIRGYYIFKEENYTTENNIETISNIKESLINEFGPPKDESKINSFDSTYNIIRWKTPSSEIRFNILEDYDSEEVLNVNIVYESREHIRSKLK